MEQDQTVRDLAPDEEQEWAKARGAGAWAGSASDSAASAYVQNAAKRYRTHVRASFGLGRRQPLSGFQVITH